MVKDQVRGVLDDRRRFGGKRRCVRRVLLGSDISVDREPDVTRPDVLGKVMRKLDVKTKVLFEFYLFIYFIKRIKCGIVQSQ